MKLLRNCNIYIIKPMILLIAVYFLNFAKFYRNMKILWKRANSTALLEILRPAETVGPNDNCFTAKPS